MVRFIELNSPSFRESYTTRLLRIILIEFAILFLVAKGVSEIAGTAKVQFRNRFVWRIARQGSPPGHVSE